MSENYLIAEQIESEIPVKEELLQEFIEIVQTYLKNLKVNNIEALYKRGEKITPEETYDFFRSQERINNTKLIIQYLISFTNSIPLEEDINKEQVNPFKQFKLFMIRTMKLLKERDVRDAIICELENTGILNDNNLWYYRGRIDLAYKEIYKLLKTANAPIYEDYKVLFLSIKTLSKFWFAQRNENIKKIRKSDYYSYKFAAILIDKIDSTTAVTKEK